MKTLYICYFGLREPLVQTQVLPYLRELSKSGIEVSLLTFEPNQKSSWTGEQIASSREGLAAEDIRWFPLPYHKSPSSVATLYDIVAGAKFAARLARNEQIDVLHARAHMPMAMAMLAKKLGANCRLIFDIRGLMAEEYADAGIWSEGSPAFKMVKRVERSGIRNADQIVVLTNRMRDWLVQQKMAHADKIQVIPCCVDLRRFDDLKDNLSNERSERFEVVYAGSVTGLYLLEDMARFFLELKAQLPNAFLRILTKSTSAARTVLEDSGLQSEDLAVVTATADEVPAYLVAARLGLSFRKPTFSQIAASPTKIPEYLAAGVPVVATSGVGDLDFIERERVGVVLDDLTQAGYQNAVARILNLVQDSGLRERCREVARSQFDLENVGGTGYSKVYQRIAISPSPNLNAAPASSIPANK